jgi:antitoxin component YwqK of YwqJK toxin-antitoxin module
MRKYMNGFLCDAAFIRGLFFIVCLVFFLPGLSYADIFYLRNGKVFEGKIIREDKNKLWIATGSDSTVGLKREDIEKIIPKEFIVPDKKSDAASRRKSGKENQKGRYGTMSAEVTYTKPVTGVDGEGAGPSFKTVQYKDGKAITHDKQYYDDGSVRMRITLEDGVANGRFSVFYQDSTLKETGFYKDGSKIGLFKTFWPNQKIQSQVKYENGQKTGPFLSYYETGPLEQELVYEKGKKSGFQKKYHENGQLSWEAMFIDDKPVGVIKRYYETGALKEEAHAAHGKTIGYFENKKIQFELYELEDRFVEYDIEGRVIYDGPVPPERKESFGDIGEQAQ